MEQRKLKILTGIVALTLTVFLSIKSVNFPTLLLPSVYLTIIILIGLLFASIVLTIVFRLAFKKQSFGVLFFTSTSILSTTFLYLTYSPTLKIVAPKGYVGEVNLVLSKIDTNVLTLDSNGIGYLDEWTFERTYSEPIVMETGGKNINIQCVGFSQTGFWGVGKSCCLSGYEILSKNFEIVPIDKIGKKQYYSKDLTLLVDTTLVLKMKLDKNSMIQTKTIKIEPNKK